MTTTIMRMKKGLKARPHDIQEIMDIFHPQIVEIHASSEDLEKDIEGQHDAQIAIHLPEYEGTTLMDMASLDESARLRSVKFYQRAIDKSRDWAKHFRGTPKLILHPGGWSNEPVKPFDKNYLYDAFYKSWKDLNRHGTHILVENMPPQPWYFGGQWNSNIFMDPKECRDQCIGNGYGFCIDITHAYMYCNHIKEIDIHQFMNIVRPIIAHIHISDGKGVDGEGLQIGEGTMPLKEILDYIKNIQVGVVLENWQGHKTDNNGVEYAGFKEGWRRIYELLGNSKNGSG